MIKILHAADLHLDSRFAALSPEKAARRRAEQRQLLNRLVETANQQSCDLLLLAGDLFDSDNAYPETLEALRRAFSACRARIFISPGNHDFAASGSAYRTAVWPENVHIFTEAAPDFVELPELNCRVWGAGFTSAYASDLLEGFSAPADGKPDIMVLHGDAMNPQSEYNAITKSQIAGSGLAYLALGHIHAQSGLLKEGQTYYAWPGCPMGRGFDELGEKGVYLVCLEQSTCKLDFVPLADRRYEILRVPAGTDALAAVLAALPQDTQNDVYRISLTGEAPQPDLRGLYRELEGRFFTLDLRDETTPPVDLWAGSGEDTLKGLFLRSLKERYDRESDPTRKQLLAQAARLGLAAMEGREADTV